MICSAGTHDVFGFGYGCECDFQTKSDSGAFEKKVLQGGSGIIDRVQTHLVLS